jgi:ferredoxin
VSATVAIRVNLAACSGFGDCARICPEVFTLDRYGFPVVRQDEGRDPDVQMRVLEARSLCPDGAIVIDEPPQ